MLLSEGLCVSLRVTSRKVINDIDEACFPGRCYTQLPCWLMMRVIGAGQVGAGHLDSTANAAIFGCDSQERWSQVRHLI